MAVPELVDAPVDDTPIPDPVEPERLSPEIKSVIEGVELDGRMNTSDEEVLANIKHSIRLGYGQVWTQGRNPEVVCLVAGGPSLDDTVDELRELVFEGALIVTVNGSYDWCIEHNFKPNAHVVIDARKENAKFLSRPVENCRYYLSSQCHPDSWERVKDRKYVGIMHAFGPDDTEIKKVLDEYYTGGRWENMGGGTTVASRTVGMLRTLGYLRFHLFGVDSCWMGMKNHAYVQDQNKNDRRIKVKANPSNHDEMSRDFFCAPWHLKQLEDFLTFIQTNHRHFLLNVHGDGLLAYALSNYANLELQGD